MSGETVVAGQRFRSRRKDTRGMIVTVYGEPFETRAGTKVSVRRSTSRRQQAILVRRLLSSDYERVGSR